MTFSALRFSRAWALAVVSATLACGTFPTTRDDGELMTLQLSLTGDVCGVTSASAWISAPDMVTKGPETLTVGNASITGTISVPAGAGRTVQVIASDSAGKQVYSGSTTVDVIDGQATTANITLIRNLANCPSSGTVVIVGTISNSLPDGGTGGGSGVDGGSTDAGVVYRGPGLTFGFDEAELTSDGVVHFFSASADRIHRFSLPSATLLPPVVGTLDAVSWAVAPDGSKAYLGYTAGRVDVVTLATNTPAFFAAAAATVSTMIVAGNLLFTIDDSGSWDTQSIFDRTTAARIGFADWRDTSRSIVWSPLQQKVYFLNSGVSPTDINMVSLANNTLGTEVDSPYHGDYNLPNPIRLLPDETGVIVGSGNIFNATNLTYRSSIGLAFTDIAFLNGKLYLIDAVGTTTQLRVLDSAFSIVSAADYPGAPKRIFAYQGKLVLITQGAGGANEVRLLAP